MNELTPLLDAWRVMRLGTREVVDGLVVPEHPPRRWAVCGGGGGAAGTGGRRRKRGWC